LLATLRHRDFALLWFAGLVSVAGDFALIAALPLHAYALTGSAAAAGGVFAASLAPRLLFGSIAGVYVDRWDRQRTMIAADFLRAALLLPLLAVVSADLLWLLYLIRLATGALNLLFEPAESALLPQLVGEERLVTANALNSLNNNLGRLLGPAPGGLLYASGGLGAVVLVDAASFAVSAALIAAIHARARPERAAATPDDDSPWIRLRDEWRAGLGVIGRNRAISAVFLSLGIGLLGEGTFEVGFAPLVIDVFAGGAAGAGLLLSGQAVGGLCAGALVARVAERFSPRALYAGGLIGVGLADLGMVNATSLTAPGPSAVALATAFMALAGFPVVACLAATNGVLQIETTDLFRGRVFGALGTLEGFPRSSVSASAAWPSTRSGWCRSSVRARRCGSSGDSWPWRGCRVTPEPSPRRRPRPSQCRLCGPFAGRPTRRSAWRRRKTKQRPA
jgi:Na+/melibiose symporter-like transporter